MTSYPQSPQELIELRFEWLSAGDFSSIYSSYHLDARFRDHFPSEAEYVQFAREQKLDELELLQLEVIDQLVRGNLARVLSFQVYCFSGQTFRYLDITSLRFDGDYWRVLSGKRHEVTDEMDLQQVDWSTVENDPEAIDY